MDSRCVPPEPGALLRAGSGARAAPGALRGSASGGSAAAGPAPSPGRRRGRRRLPSAEPRTPPSATAPFGPSAPDTAAPHLSGAALTRSGRLLPRPGRRAGRRHAPRLTTAPGNRAPPGQAGLLCHGGAAPFMRTRALGPAPGAVPGYPGRVSARRSPRGAAGAGRGGAGRGGAARPCPSLPAPLPSGPAAAPDPAPRRPRRLSGPSQPPPPS